VSKVLREGSATEKFLLPKTGPYYRLLDEIGHPCRLQTPAGIRAVIR
jgi:hypothetical protein